MIARLLAIVLGTNNARQLRQLQPIVKTINEFEPKISALSDADLANKTNEFRERLSKANILMIFCLKHLQLCEKQQSVIGTSAIMMCS